MKLTIAAAALAAALPAVASAATFTGSFDITGTAFSDPGLVVKTSPNVASLDFDLDSGQSTSVNLFRLWTDENSVQADDKTPQSIDVAFSINGGSGTLSGESYGVSKLFGVSQGGVADWASPLAIDVGTGTLTVSLFSGLLKPSTDFNWGFFGIAEGYKHGADVYASFSYEAAPVPLPAGLALILSGLGALGVVGVRRTAA